MFRRALPLEHAVTGRDMRLSCTRTDFELWFDYPAECARRVEKAPTGGMVARGILGTGY